MYPKNRKPKLSRPEDAAWFAQSYLKEVNGTRRRYLKGPCEICGEENETLWSSFTKTKYRFRHLKCAQGVWNSGQFAAAAVTTKEEIAERVMRHVRHGAEQRELAFNLTLDQFIAVSEQPCFYCNAAPTMRRTVMKAERDRAVPLFLYNGIDRKNNDIGYVWANCVACCTRCNFLKRDTPWKEWISFLNEIKKYWHG